MRLIANGLVLVLAAVIGAMLLLLVVAFLNREPVITIGVLAVIALVYVVADAVGGRER